MLHFIECHLDGFHYKHILQNVMVPSVRMLYPGGIIQFQQDHTSIHECCVVQEWLLLQADARLTDWPPRAPDMNLVKIHGVRWRGQCTKHGLSSLPEIVMRYGPICQKLRMKLLRHSITFDHRLSPWKNEWNQWLKHRGSGILKISFWK
jgi:hypothetical protein